MKACAICNAGPPLILTRQGLRCGGCLRGENETMRGMLRSFAELHQGDAGDAGAVGDMARQALKMLDG